MKVKHIISTFGILFGGLVLSRGASAVVTMEGHSDVQFTFGQTLTLSLSSTLSDCPTPYADPTFCIEDLVPGTTALSNTVTATVATNSAAGYKLSATVGGTDSTSATYATSDLTSTSHTDKFTMLNDATSTSLAAGEWGFTLNGSAATPTYMTLDTTTARTINSTIDAAGTAATGYGGTNSTAMQIGAYAGASQKAGVYRNVLNFTALPNMLMRTVTIAKSSATDVTSAAIVSVDGTALSTPVTSGTYGDGQVLGITATCASGKNFLGWASSYDFGKVADMNAATTTYTVGNGDITLTAYCGPLNMQNVTADYCVATPKYAIDSRDGKGYYIARLADGQCWMTSDLNLAGGTTLNASDSDVPTNNYYTLPASSTTGFDDNTKAYVYNTGNETILQADCTSTQPCNSYYSWLAATAGGKDASGTAVTDNGPDAAYSICPKGWRLPKSGNDSDASATSTTGYKKGDFYKLATAYGANLESSQSQSSAVFYNNAGPGTLPNFLLAGFYNSSTFRNGGANGHYWSSSSNSSTIAYKLRFDSSSVDSASSNYRQYGFSVRCVLK